MRKVFLLISPIEFEQNSLLLNIITTIYVLIKLLFMIYLYLIIVLILF